MAKGHGPISYNELFQQDVNANLKELATLVESVDTQFQELAGTIRGISGRINVNIKSNTQAFKDLDASLSKVDVTTGSASEAMQEYGKTISDTAKQTNSLKDQQVGLDKAFDIATASSNELKAQIKALTAEYLALGRTTDADKSKLTSLAQQVKAVKAEHDALTGALKTTRTTMQSAEGSYNAMSQKLNQLRKDLREIPGAFNVQTGAVNKSIPAVQKYIAEINRLDGALKKADATLGQHQRSVGNYSGALRGGIAQLGQLALGYASVQGAMQAAGAAFNSALQTDAISTVLQFTFKNADIAAEKLRMLRSEADRLGVDYISLANSYKSFTAAAIASNFSLAQAEKIFSAVSNAGAKMKLTSDQMSGALLALQQMISKGNVQAEELRGQLGERLPGAFAIAARAMGVTETRLNKMLKDGEVLAADLLPKLATELDKTFGNDKTERIESLQASWTRLKNTFDFTVESSRIGAFFKLLIDGLEGAASRFSKIVNSSSWKEFFLRAAGIANIGSGAGSAFEAFAAGEEIAANPLAPAFVQPPGVAPTGSNEPGKSGKAKTALDVLKEEIDAITVSLNLQALAAFNAKKAYAPDDATVKKLQELEDALWAAMNPGRQKQIDTKKLDTGARAANRVTGTTGGIQWVDNLTKITDIQKAQAEAPMLEMDELLERLAQADAKRQQDLTQVYSEEIQKRLKKTEDAKAAFMSAMDILRQNSSVLGEVFGQEFGNLFSDLTTTLEKFVLDGSVGFEDLAKVAISSVRAINESYQQGTVLRIEALQLEKQAQIDIAGTNKDARLNIEKEYNDRIRQEKIKQARLDKTAAVFEIGINTAIAASKVVAQTGLGGIPLVPIVIALGLAQIAAVIARPIPQFRHGRDGGPATIAEVNEDGPELLVHNGQARVANKGKRGLTYLRENEKVITAPMTKSIMEMQSIDREIDLHGRLTNRLNDARHNDQVKTMAAAFYASRVDANEIGASVGREIGKLPISSLTVDEGGVRRFIHRGRTTTEVLNNRYSLK